jgi:chromosomal replication initiator protein
LKLAQQIWDTALGELQLQVSKPNYNTWLKETRGISYQDDVFIIGVPNIFVAEWLADRLYSLITRTLSDTLSKAVNVQFLTLVSPQAETRPASVCLADGGTSAKLMDPLRSTISKPEYAFDAVTIKQPARVFNLNPRYTFEHFITGECNRMAHVAAVEITEAQGCLYNPLFIYGNSGVGKTHLLQAIAHAVKARGPRVLYMRAEHFTSEFITAIKNRNAEDFRRSFRNTNVLLLDDLHFLAGKTGTQECVFHIFNELYDTNCQIVITSDRPPKALSTLQKKLRSRLESGLVVELQTVDTETRLAILKAKAKHLKVSIPPEVMNFLAAQFPNNVRELEGALNKVANCANLSHTKLDIKLAKKAVQDLLPGDAKQTVLFSPKQIIEAVGEHYEIAQEEITGKRRDKKTALARQVAMYLLREQNHYSLTEVGRMLGDRDHTTILHGQEKITAELKSNQTLVKSIDDIRQTLLSRKSTG